MKREWISQILNGIDPAFVQEAAQAEEPGRGKKKTWMKWAACLVAAALSAAALFPRISGGTGGNLTVDTLAYYIGDFLYVPITADDQQSYPAVLERLVGRAEDNQYAITQADLGESMGTYPAGGPSASGQIHVYRFAAYPEYDAIVIIETDGWYEFFVAGGGALSASVGTGADAAMKAHGMPDSVTSLRLGADGAQLGQKGADVLCGLLTGKQAVDRTQLEQRQVQYWTDTQGNTDVRQVDGEIIYESAQAHQAFADLLEDTVVSIYIQTDKGFDRLELQWHHTFGCVYFCGQYYLLCAEETAQLNDLLGI